MTAATDSQVQNYVDVRLRPRAEQFRALVVSCADDKAAIDDVYQACAQQTPTWADNRNDGPPHLLTPQDVLVYNAVISLFAKIMEGKASSQELSDFAANIPTFQRACVRPLGA